MVSDMITLLISEVWVMLQARQYDVYDTLTGAGAFRLHSSTVKRRELHCFPLHLGLLANDIPHLRAKRMRRWPRLAGEWTMRSKFSTKIATVCYTHSSDSHRIYPPQGGVPVQVLDISLRRLRQCIGISTRLCAWMWRRGSSFARCWAWLMSTCCSKPLVGRRMMLLPCCGISGNGRAYARSFLS